MCSTYTPTFPDNNVLSNNPHNNPFLAGFSSSRGWLLVTRTRGAWWSRYRGHCRSGPRHLSPRSRFCAKEWHSEDIDSHIHTHPGIHTTQQQKREEEKREKKHISTHQTWCLRLIVLFLSSVVVGDIQQAWLLLLSTSLRRRPFHLGQYWQKTFVDVFNAYANISQQQSPF